MCHYTQTEILIPGSLLVHVKVVVETWGGIISVANLRSGYVGAVSKAFDVMIDRPLDNIIVNLKRN